MRSGRFVYAGRQRTQWLHPLNCSRTGRTTSPKSRSDSASGQADRAGARPCVDADASASRGVHPRLQEGSLSPRSDSAAPLCRWLASFNRRQTVHQNPPEPTGAAADDLAAFVDNPPRSDITARMCITHARTYTHAHEHAHKRMHRSRAERELMS